MKLLVDRKSILNDILRIESQIKTIKRDLTYRKIKRNLHYLEMRRFGRSTLHVASPDDLEKTLEMRNNSPEKRKITLRYRERKNDFEAQIEDLSVEKTRLQEQLFRYVN